MSIKRQLTLLLLLIGLVPTVAVSLVAYYTISTELNRKTVSQLESLAEKQQQKINGLLQQKQEEVIKLGNKYDMQVALSQHVAGQKSGAEQIGAIIRAKKADTANIESIYVTNPTGEIIASTLAGTGGMKPLAPADLAKSDQGALITIQEDPDDGLNKLNIATAMSVNKTDAAALTVIFRTDDILAAVQDFTGLGATGETVVVQRTLAGDALSLFPLRGDAEAALTRKLNRLKLFDNPDTSDAPNIGRTATDYRDQEVILATRTISFAGWVLATKIDRDEALATIAQLQGALMLIVAFSSVAILGIAIYFTRYFTGPILKITHAADLIGKGDFDARTDLHRRDELGFLGDSINAMGQSLHASFADLKAQRNHLEIILNSTSDGIIAINQEGVVLTTNEATAALTHKKVPDLVGKRITDIFNWTQDGESINVNYGAYGVTTYTNLQYTNSYQEIRYVKLIVARVTGERAQSQVQTIITINDETKRRELEAMKLDFVSMAAHELRTPLAAIRGYIELILFKLSGITSENEQYLRQALKSSVELGGLINNLLDVSRIERGTLTLHMEEVDLAVSVTRAIQDVSFSAKEKPVGLTYVGPDQGCTIVADEIALREVINNLINNAVKYTNAGGDIEVKLENTGESYKLSVKDNGIGIPQAALPNLFTKFFRVHGGLASGSTGTGLGLFIAKSILERHDGTITAESQEGVGSVFSFSIPAINPARLAAMKAKEQAGGITRRHRGWVTKNTPR